MTHLLDIDLISRRRIELGLSQRALARELGVSPPTVVALEQGRNHEELMLRALARLAEALALEPRDLFAAAGESGAPADDDVKLEAALAHARMRVDRDTLARALGWDVARTKAALAALAARLGGTGQMLHYNQSAGDYGLRPRDSVLSEREQQALAHGRLARSGLTLGQARLLARVMAGEIGSAWEQAASNADRVDRASLMKLGLIRLNGGEAVLTDKAAQSLGVAAKDGAS